MSRHFIAALALAAATVLIPACDHEVEENGAECSVPEIESPTHAPRMMPLAPPPGVDLSVHEFVELDDDVSFREQGPPAGLYTSKISGQAIHRDQVAKLVLSAEGLADPAQTCTLSWYQPDTSKNEMVLGLGCSMLAPMELWTHYRKIFEANNAVKF